MSFKEKMTWVYGVVTLAVGVAYLAVVGSMFDGTPVSEIDYQWWLLGAIGVTIAATILGAIGVAIATAISAEVSGRGTTATRREDGATAASTGAARSWAHVIGRLGAARAAMLREDQLGSPAPVRGLRLGLRPGR